MSESNDFPTAGIDELQEAWDHVDELGEEAHKIWPLSQYQIEDCMMVAAWAWSRT